ncbi:MAG TPA: glycosyltransferase family 2 protein [Candidatus Saccharimonadales bacterium]|nr:glycosyltransferase family 2 protein [Candidatus Saccharimonadales bacterium]
MHELYLRRVTLRTSVLLIVGQFVIVGTMAFSSPSRWYVLTALQFGLALLILASTLRHTRTTREPLLTKSYVDRDLPTLSVAIPARNETDELEECLRSLVANNYPKLEILVLDDCSSNAKTPEIIRAFAHDGVRFISGDEPEPTWLAKNWGYERLAEEANGDLILFCGVDTRFQPDGLRTLVATMLEKNKSMVSVLPHNENISFGSQLLQPLRYAWELSLPRRLFQRPPVLSTCWVIKKSLLASAGSFKAVSRSIVPESYFARTASVHDGYSFVRSNAVTSYKSVTEQRATAIRTRYPQLHRRPELVALLTLLELVGTIGPIVLCITALLDGHILVFIVGLIAYIMLSISWLVTSVITYGRVLPYSLISLPVAVLADIALMHYAMYKYEFNEVIWKGRNVCIPVMHVVANLPKA